MALEKGCGLHTALNMKFWGLYGILCQPTRSTSTPGLCTSRSHYTFISHLQALAHLPRSASEKQPMRWSMASSSDKTEEEIWRGIGKKNTGKVKKKKIWVYCTNLHSLDCRKKIWIAGKKNLMPSLKKALVEWMLLQRYAADQLSLHYCSPVPVKSSFSYLYLI